MNCTRRALTGESGVWQRYVRPAPREQSGSIIVLTAIMMVVMMGFVGLAIDVGHQMTMYRRAQNAADAAALAAAINLYQGNSATLAGATVKAKLLVQQNGFKVNSPSTGTLPDGDLKSLLFCVDKGCATTTTNVQSVSYVQAQVSASFSTYFIGVLGIGTQSVGTSATANVLNNNQICQLCALGTGSNAVDIKLTGNGTFTGTGIKVIDNSPYANALDLSGSNVSFCDSGGSIGVVGGYTTGSGTACNGADISPPPTTTEPVPDPLRTLPSLFEPPTNDSISEIYYNSSSNTHQTWGPSVTDNKGDVSTSGATTISPGIYNNITVNGNDSLTLNPGIYVIVGTFKSTGGGPIGSSGGVMLFIGCTPKTGNGLWTACNTTSSGSVTQTSQMGSLGIAGTGLLGLRAMTTTEAQTQASTLCSASPMTSCSTDLAALAGLLVYQDRGDGQNMTISGGGSIDPLDPGVQGSVYAKTAQVSVTGNGNAVLGVDSSFVSDSLVLTGSTSNGLNMTFSSGDNVNFALPPALVL